MPSSTASDSALTFTVDLRPEEYRQAMLWHQYGRTPGRRFADFVGWGVLVLTPILVAVLWILAPEALSPWFLVIAALVYLYALYTTLVVRYQIRRRAQTLPHTHPHLARVHYQVHGKGLRLQAETDPEEAPKSLFLPWHEVSQVVRLPGLYVLFVGQEDVLVVPERCVPDRERFEAFLRARSTSGEPPAQAVVGKSR